MTNSETDLDELKALQREAALLRSERQRTDSTVTPSDPEGSAASAEATVKEEEIARPAQASKRAKRRHKGSTGTASSKQTSTADSQTEAGPAADVEPLEEAIAESAKTLEDLNLDFNAILKDVEDAARERPVLTLLAAFSLGIVVGQMLSRK